MNAAARIIGLYQRHGLDWDAGRGRSLFERGWLDRFRALLVGGGSILDLGCGGGDPVAAHFITRGTAVVGVDTSPVLLDLCRARFPEQDWIEADMRRLDLGRVFSGILAWDSFFHLDHADQRSMFGVFRRHAAPHAPLLFTSGPRYGVAMGVFAGEPLHHASLDPAEYRRLLTTNGFAVIDHMAEDPTCGGHTVWLARAVG